MRGTRTLKLGNWCIRQDRLCLDFQSNPYLAESANRSKAPISALQETPSKHNGSGNIGPFGRGLLWEFLCQIWILVEGVGVRLVGT